MKISPMAPLTEIHICTDVKFNSSFEDVIYFDTLKAQLDYFNSKTLYTFNNLTPVKLYNTIAVPLVADKLTTASYLYFKNKNFTNDFNLQYIFAFITNIEYVNPNLTYITYEVDPFQTYGRFMNLLESFVERETVADDRIGYHIVEEGLDTGPYVNYNQFNVTELEKSTVLVGSTINFDLTDSAPEWSGGVYSGIHLIPFDIADSLDPRWPKSHLIGELQDFIDRATEAGKNEAIIGMVQMPTEFAHAALDEGYRKITLSFEKHYNNLGGADYVPKNNKLFCYPYNFLDISNNNGTNAVFKYEFFKYGCTFEITGVKNLTPELILYPKDYMQGKGPSGDRYNFEEKITLEGFPTCAWSSDVFKAYMAQNAIPTLLNATGSVINGGVGGFLSGGIKGALVGGITSAVGSITSALGEGYQEYIKPPQAHGSSNPTANFARGIMNYTIRQKGITEQYAKRLDKYFTMFGYKVNLIKVPQIHNRKRFDYIKTIHINITGNIPNDDIVQLKNIFNNGVRIWHDTKTIGNYILDNPII